MKLKKTDHILLLLTSLLLSSCIRSEVPPCPPLQVNLTVKDKNYFNVDKVEEEGRRSENLAFKEYVPTLYYQLCDAVTGEVMEAQGVFEVQGDEQSFPITFCDCLPHGKYVLTVWGGLKDNTPLHPDGKSVTLHPDGSEGIDVYVAQGTLVYDAYQYNHTLELQRVKGKLIIRMENLPKKISHSYKEVDNLFGKIMHGTGYEGTTSVTTQTKWESPTAVITKTMLSPSAEKDKSKLSIRFYTQPEAAEPVIKAKPVYITMNRNELTVLKYIYQEQEDDFAIYLLVNDNWEKIHGMTID